MGTSVDEQFADCNQNVRGEVLGSIEPGTRPVSPAGSQGEQPEVPAPNAKLLNIVTFSSVCPTGKARLLDAITLDPVADGPICPIGVVGHGGVILSGGNLDLERRIGHSGMYGAILPRMIKHLALLVAIGLPVLAQVTASNTITVTASRNNAATPDLVAFTIAVDTPLTTTRDDVIAALQGSGIGLANFTGVYTTFQSVTQAQSTAYTQGLEWSFAVTTPITSLKSGIALLNGLQQTLSKSGFSLSYTIQGLQTSAAAQQAQTCSQAGLIADARAQAQTIAAAASMRVLSIVSMASSVSSAAPAGCSLTVKFSLGPAI